MNYICSWLCIDEKGEESHFPQTGKVSSGRAHQEIYWRCLIVFFMTSKRFNKTCRHLLFTNAGGIPVLKGVDIRLILEGLDVQIIYTPFRYKTPKGYYGRFQNQFYEFSILEQIAGDNYSSNDLFLILDSDCVFLRPVDELFRQAAPKGFMSLEDDVSPSYVINGLSRNDMKKIYEELLGKKIMDIPSYHLGEFLLCSSANIQRISTDFTDLWPELLARHYRGTKKFNEEAHTLSYLYYRNGLRPNPGEDHMKRIWTNPVFYRNVEPSDKDLAIWHLPAEKTFGIARLYNFLIRDPDHGQHILAESYRSLIQKMMGVPFLPIGMRAEYYLKSYYRALVKRIVRLGNRLSAKSLRFGAKRPPAAIGTPKTKHSLPNRKKSAPAVK